MTRTLSMLLGQVESPRSSRFSERTGTPLMQGLLEVPWQRDSPVRQEMNMHTPPPLAYR